MKALKIISIFALVLLLAAAGLIIGLFTTAKVEVVSVASSGQPVSEERLAEIREAVQNNTFMGTLFQTPTEWKKAEDYVFLTYTVALKNSCLVPIDRIEIQVVPLSSDILQLGDLALHSLNEKSEGEFGATILADKNAHAVREVIVSYYVWGVSFTQRTTTGQ